MTDEPSNTYLVADIGGTNTRIALSKGDEIDFETLARYTNANYTSFDAVLATYLENQRAGAISGTCVALAGPVHDDVGRLTNLDWTIGKSDLAAVTGTSRVAILNDLQAQGYALDRLAPGSVSEIHPGRTGSPDATQLVVGIGTGFNGAVVHRSGDARNIVASECGHITLPVRTETQFNLANAIGQGEGGFTAVEDVLSGRGLERVYRWVVAQNGELSDGDQSRHAGDILEQAKLQHPDATKTVDLIAGLLGAITGDLSLIHLPFGGVYLVGGVARALAPHLNQDNFGQSFCEKGRFGTFMARFRVSVINDDYAALTGCVQHLVLPGFGAVDHMADP